MIRRTTPLATGARVRDGWNCSGMTTASGTVTVHRAPPQAATEAHRNESPILAVLLHGACVTNIGHRTLTASAGSAWIEPAGDLCRNVAGRDGAHLVAFVLGANLRRAGIESLVAALDRPRIVRDTALVHEARRAAGELRRGDAFSALALSGHVLSVFAKIGRLDVDAQNRAAPQWLGAVCDQIRSTFRETTDIATLAAIAGVSTAHLSRVFHSHIGVSIGAYVRELRIEWAASQLEATSTPLGQIAAAAGYFDQSHFAREFRRRFGVSPSSHRRAARRSR